MKTFDRIIMWVIVQLAVIALLYNLGLIPSHIVLDNLSWGGNSGFKWALNYMIYFVPYCVLICIIYTIVGVLVTKKVPIHSKKWWIIAVSCYVAFLIITGLGFYLDTGYAFYDTYGAAVMDVWLAPLLWLGEVELYLWIDKRFKVRPVAVKIGVGLQKAIKWMLIQYLCFALLYLSIILIIECWDCSLFDDYNTLFNFFMLGMLDSILVYTVLFAMWHSFLPEREHLWTFIIPWAIVIVLGLIRVYLVPMGIDHPLRIKIFKISYMIGVGVAPAFGALLHISTLNTNCKINKTQEWQ